jgi:hypothetical protein
VNRTLLSKLYNVSRVTLIRWEKKGVELGRLAKMGVAVDPSYVEDLAVLAQPSRFDDLTSFPPRDLCKEEKEWLRVAYSYPGGPIMDPRPRTRVGAPKGVYYDEKKNRWLPRPYFNLPSSS